MGLLKSIRKRTLKFQLNTLGLVPSVPIIQLFVHRPDCVTTITLTNFPSLYSPGKPVPCTYEVTLADMAGRTLAKTRLRVPVYGTVARTVAQLFPEVALPEYGTVSVNIRGLRNDPRHYGHLGTVHAYFFTMYHAPDWSSMGLIHPQTAFGVPAEPQNTRISELLIDPKPLKQLEVYQLNPSRETVPSALMLQTFGGETLYRHEQSMTPRQVRRMVWDLTPHKGAGYLRVVEEGLTARNSKPLVFQVFEDGAFTASHS